MSDLPAQNNIYLEYDWRTMVLEYSYKHRLRQKEIVKLQNELNESLGTKVFTDKDNVEIANLKGFDTKRTFDIIFVDNKLIGILSNNRPMLTVRGLLKYPATRKYVTVDMGAVPYVCNGADVMTPGIVDSDPSIIASDFVWIRDEKNMKPLAIGESLMSGDDLSKSEKGKGIKMVHWVGDDLWMLDNG